MGWTCMRDRSDLFGGGLIVALGLAAFWGGSSLPPVPGQNVGPNVFPAVIGIGLVLCGLAIIFGIGNSFEEPHKVVVSADGKESEDTHAVTPVRFVLLRTAVPPLLLIFYALTVDRLGFIPVAAIMIFISCIALGGPIKRALMLGAIAPIFVHLIFAKLLRVPLPHGLLPMPW